MNQQEENNFINEYEAKAYYKRQKGAKYKKLSTTKQQSKILRNGSSSFRKPKQETTPTRRMKTTTTKNIYKQQQQQPYQHYQQPYITTEPSYGPPSNELMYAHVQELQNELRVAHDHMEQMGIALRNLKEDNIKLHQQWQDNRVAKDEALKTTKSLKEAMKRTETLYEDEKKKNSLLLEQLHQMSQKLKSVEFQATMKRTSPIKYQIDHKPETPPKITPTKKKKTRPSTFPMVDVLLRDFDESTKMLLLFLESLSDAFEQPLDALALSFSIYLTTQRVIQSYIDTSNRQVYAIIESTHKQPSVTSPFGSDEMSPMKVASAMVHSMEGHDAPLPFYFTYMMNKYRKEHYLKLLDMPFLVDHIMHDLLEAQQNLPKKSLHPIRQFVKEIVPTLFCFQLCHIFLDDTSYNAQRFDIDHHDAIRDDTLKVTTNGCFIQVTVRPALIFSKDPMMSSPIKKQRQEDDTLKKSVLRKPLVRCHS